MELRKFIATTIREYLKEEQNFNVNIPNTVYHASNEIFDKFDISKITNIRGDLYGGGFYFTDNYEYAKDFGSILYECNIKLQNPIDLTNSEKVKQQLLRLLNDINNITKYDDNYIRDSIKHKNFTSAFMKLRKYLSFKDLKKYFDGVIGYSEKGGKEYVVYDPTNIKILNVTNLK